MRIDEKGWTVSEVPVSSTALIENREADLGLPYLIEGETRYGKKISNKGATRPLSLVYT